MYMAFLEASTDKDNSEYIYIYIYRDNINKTGSNGPGHHGPEMKL